MVLHSVGPVQGEYRVNGPTEGGSGNWVGLGGLIMAGLRVTGIKRARGGLVE